MNTLEIHNFGAINQAKFDIKPITILIGEQAAGKSTIAKLIAIFNDPELYVSTNEKQSFEKLLKKYNIQNYLQADKTEIRYETPFFSCIYSDNSFELISKKTTTELHHYSIYIPTERFLISILNHSALEFMNNSLTLPKSVTQFGTYFQNAKNELKSEISIEFLDIIYTNKNGDDTIQSSSKKLQLQESASGYQSVIPLFLVMKYYAEQVGTKTIIIEEPELNLYPKTQNNLVNVLAMFANINNNNLVVTTHSPYILTALNNLLLAGHLSNRNVNDNDISEIIPKGSWIHPNNFAAYHIENGTVKSIFDEKTQLITETELDSASEIINSNFDELMNIYKNIV